MELRTLTRGLIRYFTGLWPRPQLPPRYSGGWQVGTHLDGVKTSQALGFSALRRGLEIVTGQLVSTPLLDANGEPNAIIEATNPAELETAISDMIITGNGWLTLQDGQLICIQAFRVSAVLDAEGKVIYLVDSSIVLDMSSTVHLQCRNYFSPYVGDSLLEAYNESASSVMACLSIYRQLQDNGSFADVYLSTDLPLTSAQMTELRQRYLDVTAQNQGSAGGVVILSNGLKPMSLRKLPTSLEQDAIASLNFSVEECARMTGVPLSMLSTKEVSGGYNSSIESNRAFYRGTMRPLFHRVERELSRVLGVSVQYDVQELLLGTGLERADVLSKLIQVGVLSIDEARASLAYGPITAGNAHAMPLNMVPLSEWIKPKPEALNAGPAVKAPKTPIKPTVSQP